MIPAVMKLEEEADEASAGSSQVSPSGTRTRAWLTVFHHQHAGSERLTQKLLSECVCMGIKLGHRLPAAPTTQMSRGTGSLG